MATAAERHVHAFITDHFVAVFARCPESKACILFTQLADRSQLLYLFALGNEVKDCGESSSHKSAL